MPGFRHCNELACLRRPTSLQAERVWVLEKLHGGETRFGGACFSALLGSCHHHAALSSWSRFNFSSFFIISWGHLRVRSSVAWTVRITLSSYWALNRISFAALPCLHFFSHANYKSHRGAVKHFNQKLWPVTSSRVLDESKLFIRAFRA